MPDLSSEHIMRETHFAGIGNNIWHDTYAFIPAQHTADGKPVFANSEPTAYVQYESARIKWVAGDGTEFARENPGRGKVSGVVDGMTVYEKVITERLPLLGLRLGIRRRRATERVCTLLGIDPKPHLEQPEYQGLKDHL